MNERRKRSGREGVVKKRTKCLFLSTNFSKPSYQTRTPKHKETGSPSFKMSKSSIPVKAEFESPTGDSPQRPAKVPKLEPGQTSSTCSRYARQFIKRKKKDPIS